MMYVYYFALFVLWLCFITSVRNVLVYKIRSKKIKACSEEARKAVAEGRPWVSCYDSLDALSYNKMMFDIRKWTYNQFYKERK